MKKYILLINLYIVNVFGTEEILFDTILKYYNNSLNLNIDQIQIIQNNQPLEQNNKLEKNYFTTKNSFQNLRVKPYSDSKILHVLSKGTKVKLLSKSKELNQLWYKVLYINANGDNVTGYLYISKP